MFCRTARSRARLGRWFGAVGRSYDGDVGFVEPDFGGPVAVALVHDQDQSVRVVESRSSSSDGQRKRRRQPDNEVAQGALGAADPDARASPTRWKMNA
jgi:hypothetical protein